MHVSISLDALVVLHGFYCKGSNYGYDFKVKCAIVGDMCSKVFEIFIDKVGFKRD